MRNSVCVAFVHLAELRVDALRGLRALAPADPAYLADDLAEAEYHLELRRMILAGCDGVRCPQHCRLFAPPPASQPASPRSAAA